MLCPRCQVTVDPGAVFCGNCGLQLSADSVPPMVEQSQSPLPGEYSAPSQSAAISNNADPQSAMTASIINANDHSGKAVASLIVAVMALPATLIPICGLVLGILAIIFGTLSVHSARKLLAIAGLSIATLAVLASLFLWVKNSQDLVQQQQAGVPVKTTSAEAQLQAVDTPCYTTKIPVDMKITRADGSCSFQGANQSGSELIQVKVLEVSELTLAGLPAAAKEDAANVVGSIPGGTVKSQRSATFAGSQAYEIAFGSTDGSSGLISYVYDTTSQGNIVIVLHTQARGSTGTFDLRSIESKWSWL